MKIQSGYKILSNIRFSVKNKLTTCRNLNSRNYANYGLSYNAEIDVPFGYTLEGASKSVTMGGVDITTQVFNGNTISIPRVTGNIEITITAVSANLTPGLYRDGELVTSWASIVSTYPNAFATTGTIVGSSTTASYLTALNGDLVIDSSITRITTGAFASCPNLTNVYIPSSVTALGNGAFREDSGLTEFVIPSSIINLGRSSFYNNFNVGILYYNSNATTSGSETSMSVSYPGATESGRDADNGLEVIIGSNVTSLMPYWLLRSYVSKIHIPASLVNITGNMIGFLSDYTEVEIDEDNTKYEVVNNCLIDKTNNHIVAGFPGFIIPEDSIYTDIDAYAFINTNSGETLVIPDNIQTINEYAFADNTTASTIKIGTGVATIKNVAFGRGVLAPTFSDVYFYMNNLTSMTTAFTVKTTRSLNVYCKPTNTVVINYNWANDKINATISQTL